MVTKMKATLLALALLATMIFAGCSTQTTEAPAAESEAPATETETTETEEPAIDFPTETITVIVPFAAGGGADLDARRYADAINQSGSIDQTIIVENITGGSGVVGATELVNSDPDGHTLMQVGQGCVTVQTNLGNTTYAYDDLEPVICLAQDPIGLIVGADSSISSVEDLIAAANEKEGGLLMGFAGPGTYGHTGGMSFVNEAGIPYTEVQFDGTSTAMAALLGGHIDTYMSSYTDLQNYVNSGEAKMIFATTRTDSVPDDVQVLTEEGYDVTITAYITLYAPKDTPDEIKDILYDLYATAGQSDIVQEAAALIGREPIAIGRDEMETYIDEDYVNVAEILKKVGMLE